MAKSPCAKCGSCTSVCPVYQVTGKESLTARGRLHLLEKLGGTTPSEEYIDIFSRCLLCNACKIGCPRGIDLPSMVVEARHDFPALSGEGSFKKYLVEKTLASERLLKSICALLKLSGPLLENLPKSSGLRLKLGIISGDSPEPSDPLPHDEPDAKGSDKIQLFRGCLATHIYPQIATATKKIVSDELDLGISSPDQNCCGLASHSCGDIETAINLAKQNILAFDTNNSKILTPCASCFSHLSTYPELLADDSEWAEKAQHFTSRLEELSTFLSPNSHKIPGIESGRKLRVFYHDPCHLRFRSGDYTNPPREILSSFTGIELVELPRGPRCCGLGGLFNLAHPDLSDKIGSRLIDEVKELHPDIVVSTCSGCLLQLKLLLGSEKDLNIEVCHLAEFLNKY